MRLSRKWIVVAVVGVSVFVGAGFFAMSRLPAKFRQAEVTRGDIISVINSTGTIQPVTTVPVSPADVRTQGKVTKIYVDNNAEVTKGQVLAEIDVNPNSDPVKVISPVDGIVTARRIQEGQTFVQGDMFSIAKDLKKNVEIYASIDEADIGLIRAARLEKQPVHFTLDSYPEDLFQGQIQDILINPTVSQGVVTYHVVVNAPNAELKLLPGMTAKLSFQIDKRTDVIKIPSAALRFFPKSRVVHPDDRQILEGTGEEDLRKADSDSQTKDTRSAVQRSEERRKDKETHRHVWVVDGEFLRAIKVSTGLNDNTYTEMVSGNLQPGQKLVTGLR